jgi:hypothetical protein
MTKFKSFLIDRSPKRCSGCGEPFPVRHGRAEALVGFDDQLYCYAMNAACAAQAVTASTLSRAA